MLHHLVSTSPQSMPDRYWMHTGCVASSQRLAAGFTVAAAPASPAILVTDVLFPVALADQPDLLHDAEQFSSKRGCVLHANVTIIVPEETVRDIGIKHFFEQQAIDRDLIPGCHAGGLIADSFRT